ncbi:MAG: outer membrane beta-barrel protein [Pseudomonadota bacterium]
MVLTTSRFFPFAIGTALLAASAAEGQAIDETAPVLDQVEDFAPIGVRSGGFILYPSIALGLEYTSNLFAAPAGEVEDVRATIAPGLIAEREGDALRIRGTASAAINRYVDRTSENSVAALLQLDAAYRFSETDRLRYEGHWRRRVEDRGDPEARTLLGLGPRLIDIVSGEFEYERTGTRLGFGLLAGASRFDHRSAIDAERDYDEIRLSGRLSYRLGGRTNIFVRPFYTQRDFRLATDDSGVNRDAITYGARAGVEFDAEGRLRGSLGIGAFRFDPEDGALDERTGLSVQGSLIYQPVERTAFLFDAFRGDVATFRAGVTSRVDTRISFGIQQEVRHNLRFQSSLFYRRTNFIDGGDEETVGGLAELEYRLNRAMAVAFTGQYSDRGSSNPDDRFDRFRGGVELRLRY